MLRTVQTTQIDESYHRIFMALIWVLRGDDVEEEYGKEMVPICVVFLSASCSLRLRIIESLRLENPCKIIDSARATTAPRLT